MKKVNACGLLLLLVLCSFGYKGYTQDTAFNPNAVGVRLDEVLAHLRTTPAADNDSGEGGQEPRFMELESFWSKRVTTNTDSSINMFAQYRSAASDAAHARYIGACNAAGKFQGAWKCIGPLSLPTQNMGKVECIWADPSNANIILAGTYGGIFRTANGGLTWTNITDGAPVVNSLFTISSIDVCPDPTYSNYISASTNSGLLLTSTNGGARPC